MNSQFEKINSLLSNFSTTENECEFRFGEHKNNKFSPGVSKEQFDKVFMFVKSFAEYKRTEFENTLTISENEIRERISIKGDPFVPFIENQIIKKEIIKKETKEKTDIPEIGVRFAISKETPIEGTVKNGTYFKAMHRFSFYYLCFKIEMSIFKASDSFEELYAKELRFDIEIEIIETPSETGVVSKFICDIAKILGDSFDKKFVIDTYQLLTKQKNYFGTQPIALRAERINKKEEYSVSLKLDGIRVMLIVIQDKLYFINAKFQCGPVGESLESNKFDGCVFDTEYKEGVYHIFDCIIFKNKDLRKTNGEFLKKRLEYISTFLGFLKDPMIIMKTHSFGDLHSTVMKMIKKSINENYDGLIFTPVNQLYPRNNKCPGVPLKWKTAKANTIDFRIKKEIIEGEYSLYVANETEEIPFSVVDYPDIHKIQFVDEIKDGIIVECYFDTKTNKFKIIKERADKNRPNYYTVANDNFDLVINPFDFGDLHAKRKNTYFFNMRRFHNWIKRTILDEFTVKNGKGGHLDLACGKGGDIFKYFDNSVRHLQGYDICSESIISAKARLAKAVEGPIHKNSDYNFFTMDLSKEMIETPVIFDSASSFFAIHYFFKSEKDLDNFIANTKNLQVGGHLMVTCFAGDRLREQNYNITTDKFKITKGTVDSTKKFGNSIDVFLEDTVLDNATTEYVVDIEFLIKKMLSKGFKLVLNKYFDEYYSDWASNDNYLNNISKRFSFLNKALVFKKVSQEPKELSWDMVDDTMELNRKTIAELKSLAKEKGITIPKQAKKADIIALLQ